MGLFDQFKKKKGTEEQENQEEQEEQEEQVNTCGWDAITNAFEQIYPAQSNPLHYGTLVNWRLGGKDPLDGISIYDGGEFWHFITFGLSELYEKESEDAQISGYGMEFTLKLKKACYVDEKAELECICGILQSLARITFTKGEVFYPYEYIYTGQTQGMDSKAQSNITGFITIPETCTAFVDTPNGKVEFVELIGVADSELRAVRNKEIGVEELYEKLGTDVTDYDRNAVL